LRIGITLLALLLAISACGGNSPDEPFLTPLDVEGLAAKEARVAGSNVLIGCHAIAFRDDSRTWLVECIQEKKTSWVVDDRTKEVRSADEVSGSPMETAD
jgi:hypothetical protein